VAIPESLGADRNLKIHQVGEHTELTEIDRLSLHFKCYQGCICFTQPFIYDKISYEKVSFDWSLSILRLYTFHYAQE
jgi:hypothetical protein